MELLCSYGQYKKQNKQKKQAKTKQQQNKKKQYQRLNTNDLHIKWDWNVGTVSLLHIYGNEAHEFWRLMSHKGSCSEGVFS